MFNKTRKKLTLLYAVTFMLFLLVILSIVYFSLQHVMERQQLEELEKYYVEQQHDLLEYKFDNDRDDRKRLSFEPNRAYFYYTYDKNRALIHGDESYEGLYKVVNAVFVKEAIDQTTVHKVEWQEEHFLLLKYPVKFGDELEGYIVLGKAITGQVHFFRNVLFVFIVLTAGATLVIAMLSYYLAGRAMVPIQQSFDKQRKFVADASHELRTPLSVFYSSVELLETDPDNLLSTFSEELVQDLKTESKLMENLLKELLFLARNDQNQLSLEKNEIHFSAVLEKLGERFARTLPKELAFQMDIAANIKLIGDATRLEELVYVLLDNAAQYTKEGHITLRLKKVGSAVQIIVQDTGVGISKTDIPLVFDRFYRGDSARKRTGTGLGLSIAKTIVEKHEGKIWVNSEEGKGTSFIVELPLK